LRLFRECPERYYRKYIARERMTAEFSRAMHRGSAVHKTLATIFNARRDHEPDPAIRPLAEQFLPRHLYAKAAQFDEWPGDIAHVEHLVANALEKISPLATVLQVEEKVEYMLGTRTAAAGAMLIGKVDLLIRHPENILEHIEFKTGSAGPDLYQDVICRIGVVDKYGQAGLPIFSTTLQLSTGDEFTLDGDKSIRDSVYPEIVQTIRDIWDAETWIARENDSCRFCEYRTSLCSIHGEWSAPYRLVARED
jgi:hypothetical protein